MPSQETEKKLGKVAYDWYLELYENPDRSYHYREIAGELESRDIPNSLRIVDFVADCIDQGVRDSEIRRARTPDELFDYLLD